MKMARWVTFGAVAWTALCACSGPAANGASENIPVPSASPVLQAMVDRYANCRSYEDTGEIFQALIYDDRAGRDEARATFATLFNRTTEDFRFDYEITYDRFLQPQKAIIWQHGGTTAHLWWSADPVVRNEDLSTLLNAQGGVSKGASDGVPPMLVGRGAGDLHEYSFHADGEEVVKGIPCVRLTARNGETLVVLWIGKVDRGLRKLFERRRYAGRHSEPAGTARIDGGAAERPVRAFTSETTIVYQPAFDRTPAPARFVVTLPTIRQ